MATTSNYLPPTPDENGGQRNAALYWTQTSTLHMSDTPTGALNLNVDGRVAVGPLQGFGQLWQKTYQLRLPGSIMTPVEVMQEWKANFARFQPPDNRFYAVQGRSMEPGQTILINATMTGIALPTGVIVLYADDESFALMTPQGHPEAGWITFSAYTEESELVCEVQSLARASDPLYEIGFRLLGSQVQEQIWVHVLKELAAHLQQEGQISMEKVCVDSRIQWSAARNIWQNAAIHSMLYTLSLPVRKLRRKA
ncbi:DUF1990 family protein [Dictyobacter formicarum]|uniref:DUF1990 domain-containing protein n=1 Tax=Dictyobacter formicarum TaxID=2778368 RepID=A0ABQ3VVG9_9CHLR|nr:DUF1990 family protein [Dictyobacter formicarum]GHO89558.1 hypothetical protein KSZ_75640 [Dictyobacter formicarum]